MNPETHMRDLPGGTVVKTLPFHCRGQGFNPWLGNKKKKNPKNKQKKRNSHETGRELYEIILLFKFNLKKKSTQHFHLV